MPVLYTLWVALCLLITIVWLTRHIDLARARRRVDTLASNSFDGPPEPTPACSVIVAAKDEEVWPSPPIREKIAPDFRNAVPFSDFTLSGREAFPEVVAPLYEEINKIYGTDFKPGL